MLSVSEMLESTDEIESNINNSYLHSRFKKRNKNSKSGCLNCKQRKIKCDENLPICQYCFKRDINCSYLTMTPFQINHLLLQKKINSSNSNMSNNTHYFDDYTFSDDLLNSNYFNEQILEKPSIYSQYNDSHIDYKNFEYQKYREINLNNDMINMDNSIYKAHEIEGIILPDSMGNNLLQKESTYTPLKTLNEYYNINIIERSNNNFDEPLFTNAKIINRTIKLNKQTEIDKITRFSERSSLIHDCLLAKNFRKLFQILKSVNIDDEVKIDYYETLAIGQIFSKLLRASFLLYSIDYYKNTLLYQKILPLINYQIKLSICCKCENDSIITINNITNIIKTEYLPIYNEFLLGRTNLITGCFLVLNYCLVYHFKNGLKFELDENEGKKCVNLLGIFSTGLYSIVMNKSRMDLLLTGSNILSAHLIRDFKTILTTNYKIEALDEVKKIFDKLNNKFLNNVNYENLKIFLNKHLRLLKINANNKTILSFDNGYLIQLINSYISIIPYDMSNFESNSNEDTNILIKLFYFTVGKILNAMVPSIEMFASCDFLGSGWDIVKFGKINRLIELIGLIRLNENKIIGIFLIRISIFLTKRTVIYDNYFNTFKMEFLFDEEITITEKYNKLLKLKHFEVLKEIQVKSFSINKGQFFRKWNYPNSENLKPERNCKVSDNKILNTFQTEDNLINDFVNTGTGFFSYDYTGDSSDKTIIECMEFISGSEMKKLWSLVVYLRINNL